MEKIITFFGKRMKVGCDGKCNKAWGKAKRPKQTLNPSDPDDFSWLADSEIAEQAPADPGSRESGDSKPVSQDNLLNSWCVMQCERCVKNERQLETPLNLITFDKRVYSKPWMH
jgi:hypothetical protein